MLKPCFPWWDQVYIVIGAHLLNNLGYILAFIHYSLSSISNKVMSILRLHAGDFSPNCSCIFVTMIPALAISSARFFHISSLFITPILPLSPFPPQYLDHLSSIVHQSCSTVSLLGTVFGPLGPSESQQVTDPWLPTQNSVQQAYIGFPYLFCSSRMRCNKITFLQLRNPLLPCIITKSTDILKMNALLLVEVSTNFMYLRLAKSTGMSVIKWEWWSFAPVTLTAGRHGLWFDGCYDDALKTTNHYSRKDLCDNTDRSMRPKKAVSRLAFDARAVL